MNDYVKFVKCYDTLKGEYVLVPVTVEVEQFIKRSYWKEDMQERRYYKRKIDFEEYTKFSNGIYCEDNVFERLVREFDLNNMKSIIKTLSRTERLILYRVYYDEIALNKIAKEIGVSSSYMSRLLRKILKGISDKMPRE